MHLLGVEWSPPVWCRGAVLDAFENKLRHSLQVNRLFGGDFLPVLDILVSFYTAPSLIEVSFHLIYFSYSIAQRSCTLRLDDDSFDGTCTLGTIFLATEASTSFFKGDISQNFQFSGP